MTPYKAKSGTLTIYGESNEINLVIDPDIAEYECGCPIPILGHHLTEEEDRVVRVIYDAPGVCKEHGMGVVRKKP